MKTKKAMVRLRVRSAGPFALFYRQPLFALAKHLGVKADQRSILAWCAQQGIGIDAFTLAPAEGRAVQQLWVDARHQNGVFWNGDTQSVIGTLTNGKVKGDAELATWLPLLPATAPIEWQGAARPASEKKPPEGPPLTARVELELTSRAQLTKLSATHRKQLEAASKELCGKRGLVALMKWCDEAEQGLARVLVSEGKTERFEGWLAAGLEDGVFFDAGQSKESGLVISQSTVSASKSARQPEVASLQRAMSKLRAPRAPRWKG